MKPATISDAPKVLNINDRAMWVLGFNAAIESVKPFTEDEIDQLYLSKVAGRGPFDDIRSAFHAMVRTIEQAHGIGTLPPVVEGDERGR
jgi:hypothetical protein